MSTLPANHRIGPYRIIRLLGEGGMGSVYEARQEPLDRRVALKTLHPEYARNLEAVARFFNEAKVLSRLEHLSIVHASDFGTAPDGAAYLVMEFLRGETLGSRLRSVRARGASLPLLTALQVAWQVADVLAVAHAQGIVHRDLKPDNLMLIADPIAPSGERVKLLDFGIAKLTQPDDPGGVRTNTQAVMGTPLYMSPEQCAGAGGVDDRSDVYSLGCVLYEALSGQPPFVGDGAGQLIGMHLFQPPPPLSSRAPKLPSGVAEFVDRLLTKDKSLRPSMSEVADAIGRLLTKQVGASPMVRTPIVTPTDPNATRILEPTPPSTLGHSSGQQTFPGRQRWRVLLAGAAGLGLSAAVFTILRGAVVGHPQARPASLAITPPAAPSSPSSWSVVTDPPGAAVIRVRDETVLGKTPWTSSHSIEPGVEQFKLHLDGYEDRLITLQKNGHAHVREALAPQRPPPPDQAKVLPATTLPPKARSRPSNPTTPRKTEEARASHGMVQPVD